MRIEIDYAVPAEVETKRQIRSVAHLQEFEDKIDAHRFKTARAMLEQRFNVWAIPAKEWAPLIYDTCRDLPHIDCAKVQFLDLTNALIHLDCAKCS